jgi:UDP-N-acetylmuramate--alanine ligase
MRLQKSKFHFVGVGGIGMCGLAELLYNMGAQVTGSDLSENANTERLKKLGVKIFKGHAAENLGETDVVVYSSAVQYQNPELAMARAKQIPLIPRAEALAELMRIKRGVAIAGTHGKTTTTSMVAAIFLEAKVSPTIVVGGRFDLIQSTAQLGSGEWLIAEADESDGSFLKLSPELGIITNIDSDHLDFYKSFENIEKAFYDFALRIPFYGQVIACGDDPTIKKNFEHFPKRVTFYGFHGNNDYVLKGGNSHYELFREKERLGDFELNVPGRHNALNAAAAIISGLAAGFDFSTCRQGLLKFQGVDRRFHFKGEASGIKVYDDYGHHPTEVNAVLAAVKEKFPSNRLVVLFQPHRFSRTQHCWHEFTTCFSMADELMVLDIYPAGEDPIAGITTEHLIEEMKHHSCRHFIRSETEIQNLVNSQLKNGDIFLTLGAGDGWKIGMQVLDLLKALIKNA